MRARPRHVMHVIEGMFPHPILFHEKVPAALFTLWATMPVSCATMKDAPARKAGMKMRRSSGRCEGVPIEKTQGMQSESGHASFHPFLFATMQLLAAPRAAPRTIGARATAPRKTSRAYLRASPFSICRVSKPAASSTALRIQAPPFSPPRFSFTKSPRLHAPLDASCST